MRRNVIYTMARPEAEIWAIRNLIAERSGLNANEIYPFAISEGNDHGRVYYAAIEPETERGLIFTIARRSDFNPKPLSEWPPQHVSEGEIKDLWKLARKLSMHKFTMLAPLRIFENDIQTLSNQ